MTLSCPLEIQRTSTSSEEHPLVSSHSYCYFSFLPLFLLFPATLLNKVASFYSNLPFENYSTISGRCLIIKPSNPVCFYQASCITTGSPFFVQCGSKFWSNLSVSSDQSFLPARQSAAGEGELIAALARRSSSLFPSNTLAAFVRLLTQQLSL